MTEGGGFEYTEAISRMGIWQSRRRDFAIPEGRLIFEDTYSLPSGIAKARMPGQPKPILDVVSVYKDVMKYSSIQSFEQFLVTSKEKPRVFVVWAPCAHERKRIVERIVRALSSHEPLLTRDVGEGPFKGVIEELNTRSLLLGEKVLYLNGVEKLKKGDLTLLSAYVDSPAASSTLIIGGAKGVLELSTKKNLTLCDLSDEKPWDKKNRLKAQVVQRVHAAGKKIAPAAIDRLLESIGPSLPDLEQEVDKLIAYKGDLGEVTLEDVRLLCKVERERSLFELVDQALFGKQPCFREEVELSLLLPFISQARQQLQQGMGVATLLARGVSPSEIAHHLQTVKPQALERLLSPARLRPPSFFKRSLHLLFETEMLAKNSNLEPGLILDLFLAKLRKV